MKAACAIFFMFACQFSAPAFAIPKDFSKISLGQPMAETVSGLVPKYPFMASASSIIYQDGHVEDFKGRDEELAKKVADLSNQNDGGACFLVNRGWDKEAKISRVMTFICAKQSGKEGDDPIRGYRLVHFITDLDLKTLKSTNDPRKVKTPLMIASFYFNSKKSTEIGSGLIGKFGPDYETSKQECSAGAKEEFKLKDGAVCFTALWIDAKAKLYAQAEGYGKDLKSGRIFSLDLSDQTLRDKAKPVLASDEGNEDKQKAKQLGF